MGGIRVLLMTAALVGCSTESQHQLDEAVASVTEPGLLGGEIAIATTGKTPAVASNGTTFLVVWDDGADLRGTRVTTTGTVLDNPFVISNASGEQIEPQVASNGTDYMVVWSSAADIYAATVTADGVAQPAFALHTGTGTQDAPRIASNGSNYLAVWESELGDHFDVWANRIVGGAAADGQGFVVMETAYGELPAVGSLGTDYLVSWTEYRDHVQADVFGQRVTAAGALTGGNITIDSAVGYQGHSTISTNGTSYLVAWDDTRSDTATDTTSGYDMYATHVASDGTVGSEITLSAHATHQWLPALASNGTDYFVAWEDDRNNSLDVYGDLVAGSTVATPDGFGIATSIDRESRPAIGYDSAALGYLIAYESATGIHARIVKQCGDGVIQSGEGCDDGNTAGGDGCSAVCGVEMGFTCTAASPSVCSDINECATNNGGCAQTCTNSVGSYACGCTAGYGLAADGFSCTDIDECATANGGCGQTCTNSVGSYACTCTAGFSLAGDGHACDDVDECAVVNGGCAQLCNNAPGSFSCACNPGFTLDANFATCTDIDECATANGGCSETCTNSPGGFACGCAANEGLAADGKTCMACAAGFVGDGTSCADIDECATSTDTCGTDQTCTNTAGSFTCEDGGGCSATGSHQGVWLVVAIGLLLRRRRR